MRKTPKIRFDRQARRNAMLCVVAAVSIAACAADGGAPDDGADKAVDEQTAALQAPGGVAVTEVAASGSGCPSGSWRSTVSDDGSRVTVAFRRFYGDMTSKARATKNCTVSIDVRGQDGNQYAPASVHLAGSSDSNVVYSAALRWSGTSNTKELAAEAAGTFDRAFFTSDFWSPCGEEQRLHVSSQVAGKGGSSRKEFELIEEVITFRSRRCPGTPEPKPSPQPSDETTPPPSPPSSAVSISGASTSGAGCPAGTTKVALASDGEAVSISFDSSNGASSPACNIVLQVEAPAGQSYALSGFTATGQASLAAGATARLVSNTAYTGLGVDLAQERVHEIVGPVSGPVSFQEEFKNDELNFSPCDGTRPSLRLTVRPSIPSGVQGSFQLTAIHSLKFALRSCQ